jgi:hypothetical protein
MKPFFGAVLGASLLLAGPVARADGDSGQHQDSDDGYVVNNASKEAFAQGFVGFSDSKQATELGVRYTAAFKTTYRAEKGDLSSRASLSFRLEKGMDGPFTLWALARDGHSDGAHGDDKDGERAASLEIIYVARGAEFANQERAAIAAKAEALILQRSSGLIAGLFGKSDMAIDLCAGGMQRDGGMSGCPASVLKLTAKVVPFRAEVLDAWQKDTNVGCGAVRLVQQISADSQCLSLAGHASRYGDNNMASTSSSVTVVATTETAKVAAAVTMAPTPTSSLYEMCQKYAGGGGEIPGPIARQ